MPTPITTQAPRNSGSEWLKPIIVSPIAITAPLSASSIRPPVRAIMRPLSGASRPETRMPSDSAP